MKVLLVLVAALALSRASTTIASNPLHVPPVIIGCWQLLERDRSAENAVNTLLAYADAGFTAFDTADIYGESQALVGRFRQKLKDKSGQAALDRIQVFTKYVTQHGGRAEADRINAQSRKDLQQDTLDLVQFHWWDFQDKSYLQVASEHLRGLQAANKIRHVGLCNFDMKGAKPVIEAARKAGLKIASNQIQYSLVDRRPENGMLALAKKEGMKMTCFGTVAGGWLSDKWLGKSSREAQNFVQRRGAGSTVSTGMYFQGLQEWTKGDWGLFQELLQVLRKVADEKGEELGIAISIANIAVQWVLDQLTIKGAGGGAIIGVRDAAHLSETKVILEHSEGALRLTQTQLAEIDSVLSKGQFPKGDIWSDHRGGGDAEEL